MPRQPTGHILDLTTQAILLYGSWVLTVATLAGAVWMGRREHTSFYPLLVLAVLVGAFVEPIYDVAMMLYFYSTKGFVTHFTAFGIPQPMWTHSGYVVLYAVPALLLVNAGMRGVLDFRRVYFFAALEFLMSCVFEIIGINGGAYEYWGPHVLRIGGYPVIIGVLETVQVVTFAMVALSIHRRLSGTSGGLSLFVLFPCIFLGVNLGVGWPVVIAIHLSAGSSIIVMAGTLLSLILSGVVIRVAAGLVPVVVNVVDVNTKVSSV